jgi:hypothetical protein
MSCIQTRRLHRSTSRWSVALALAVRLVTPSRGSTTHQPIAPALLCLCRASGRAVFAAQLLVGRSHWLSPCARSFRLAARLLHRLYCSYAMHPDAPSSPLGFSSVGRTCYLCAPGHSVSRLNYSPLGCTDSVAPMPCIRTRHLRHSTSRQSVALAIVVCPVTPSRSSTTRRPVAPALLCLCRAPRHAVLPLDYSLILHRLRLAP